MSNIRMEPKQSNRTAPVAECPSTVYLKAALPQIPRLLGMLDRNPFRATYGCFDKQYWHYRTASFPSEMYQEGVLPLALVYAHNLPENPWQANKQLREWIIAGMRYSARSCHKDGSCDDYYPFERALGAAVFSFCAATEAARLIDLDFDDAHHAEILDWLRLRGRWIAENGESGTLANHHALAALGLFRMAGLCHKQHFAELAVIKLADVLAMQNQEGWFNEYGGADPGYQTVTIDCLTKIRELLRADDDLSATAARQHCDSTTLNAALSSAINFCELFRHPDSSYGGAYGSRGTLHCYPHGFEQLGRDRNFAEADTAAKLAQAFRQALATDRVGHFDDDRMFVHRLGNLVEAYVDAAPGNAHSYKQQVGEADGARPVVHLPDAGMLVVRSEKNHTVISSARGGVFAHANSDCTHQGDAGLIVEFVDGRIAVSQSHDHTREVRLADDQNTKRRRLELNIRGPLHFAKFEMVTPLKQSVLHIGMITAGRFMRTLVRRLLQKRTITGRQVAPVSLTRKFEIVLPAASSSDVALTKAHRFRVTDTIELTDPKLFLKRMSYGIGFEAAYVAASGVFRFDQLQPWESLDAELAVLNAERRVQIIREFPATALRAFAGSDDTAFSSPRSSRAAA